jgi:apolipoprotein N-acyltransferase
MKFPTISSEFYRKIGLVVLSGVLSIFIFPSYDVELLAWVAFVPLFTAIEQENLKNAFWLGWGAGVIHFLGTLYWVIVAMVVYGDLPRIAGGAVLLLMAAYLSLYLGSFCMIIRYMQQKTALPLIITAPVVWVGLEYLRSFFLLGFPWNLLGYSQFLTPYVTQIADITGVYGISFLIILVNGCVYTCLSAQTSWRTKVKTLVSTLCCAVLCVGYSLFILPSKEFAKTGNPEHEGSSQMVRVAVIQGNIDQRVKWNPDYRQQILDTYIRLSEATLDKHPELIIWPETAVPFVFQYKPHYSYRSQLIDAIQKFDTYLLFGGQDISLAFRLTKKSLENLRNEGIPGEILEGLQSLKDQEITGENTFLDAVEKLIGREQTLNYKERILKHALTPKGYNSFNSAFFLSPEGRLLAKYDKIHLVPFGEYVPFKKILFFIDKFVTAIGEVQPGEAYEVMMFHEKSFSTVICFEIIFPDLVRKFVDRDAQFLVTITNDAWYGKSAAPYQHFAMATFRAIENRASIARAANTGISGFIDPYGRIIEQSEIFVEDGLVQDIPLRWRTTFYTRYGDVFARLCLLLSALWIGYAWYKNKILKHRG